MRFKEDWEKSARRLDAFWNQQILDRCCISVTVPGNDGEIIPDKDNDRISYWTDPERVIRRTRRLMETTYYGGDAFPCASMLLGVSGHAGYFKNVRYQLGEIIWFFKSLSDWNELAFDENSFLYQKTLELAKAFAQDSQGDYFIGMPDSGGCMDVLYLLFGAQELLTSMMEEPECVKEALAKVEKASERISGEVYDIVKNTNQGGSCVQGLLTWAPGFHSQLQCDMSVMISNDLFEDIVMPELRAQCDWMEYPLYHMDGVEQLRHLDSILSLQKLRAIQWSQMDSQKPCTAYIAELKKIQAAGKSLVIGVSPEQIRPLMENLSSKGLYLLTQASSREEADAIVETVKKLTHE